MAKILDSTAGRLDADARPHVGRRLLIVDDEQVLLTGYARALRSLFEVHTASSGHDALALLERDPAFDLVLCDLGLGDMDGADLHETIARRHPRLAERMLFCSGGAASTRLSAFAHTMSERILYKPVTIHELRAGLLAFGDRFDE